MNLNRIRACFNLITLVAGSKLLAEILPPGHLLAAFLFSASNSVFVVAWSSSSCGLRYRIVSLAIRSMKRIPLR